MEVHREIEHTKVIDLKYIINNVKAVSTTEKKVIQESAKDLQMEFGINSPVIFYSSVLKQMANVRPSKVRVEWIRATHKLIKGVLGQLAIRGVYVNHPDLLKERCSDSRVDPTYGRHSTIYLDSGEPIKVIYDLNDEKIERYALTAADYLIQRRYIPTLIHSINFDISVRSMNTPLQPTPMVQVCMIEI